MPRSGINKRKRDSIQHVLDQQVLEVAKHEARLEESQLEEEFDAPSASILTFRRGILEHQERMAESRRKITLEKIKENIEATLERFDYAKASLNESAAARIKEVEDEHAKKQLEHDRERRAIEKEEKKRRDSLNRSKADYTIFHSDTCNGLENLVATVQNPEVDDEEEPEEEEEEEDQEDQDQEDQDQED